MSENPQVSFPSLKVYPFRNESLFRLAIEEAKKLFFRKDCVSWLLQVVSHYYKPLQGAQNQWEKLAGTKIFKNVCILEHPIATLWRIRIN